MLNDIYQFASPAPVAASPSLHTVKLDSINRGLQIIYKLSLSMNIYISVRQVQQIDILHAVDR